MPKLHRGCARTGLPRWRDALGALASTAFLLLGGACAEERPPINQVQPNALDKSTFIDTEWYALQTVIDTPAQTTAAFVGESSSLDKIVWEIQEDFLIARQKRQHIGRIEEEAISGDGAVQGSVIAMYAVESHFDIRRDYNASTGEELNVIRENTTDRPWYEREHFRVDWSRNLVSSEDLGVTGAFSGVTLEPIQYAIQNPDHPFAPHFEADADARVHYFDIVNKYFASPETIVTSTGEEVPSCFLTFGSNTPCEPAEIAVRTSFMRVEPDRDYEPMVYTTERMERAGYFLTWRDEFDPDYGVISGRRLRLVNRHSIWEASHQLNDAGEWVDCRSNSDCERFGVGSVCDTAIARAKEVAGQCTIPYRERTVRPIAYHVSEGFPEALLPDARAFANGWSDALRETIGSLRELECQASGDSSCGGQRTRDDAAHPFVLCSSPVGEDEPEVCGPPGTVARIGDVRFNHVAWVPEVTTGPLGYGPSFADPETGEIVSAAAYVYGAEVNRLSSWARDLLALINDDLDESEVMDNADFGAWIQRVRSGRSFEATPREADRHVVPIDAADGPEISGSMSFDWLHDLIDETAPASAPMTRESAVERFPAVKSRVIEAVANLHLGDQARAAASLIDGTDIEQLMSVEDMRLAAGMSPLDPVQSTDAARVSPLRGMSLDRFRAVDQVQREVQGAPGSCVLKADFVDDGLLGLVEELNRAVASGDGQVSWYGVDYDVAQRNDEGDIQGIDYDRVAEMLMHPIFNAVTAHEVGHTLGLRHNFAGSFDSLNYHPRYWELRNDGNMEPRHSDPMTQDEIDGRIREYQYSTVMDYGNNFIVTDSEGVGHYDRAAIKLGYGDLVEVFEDAPEQNKALVAQIGALQRFGWPGAIDLINWRPDAPLVSVPYTRMPELLGGVESLEARADVPYSKLTADPVVRDLAGISLGVVDDVGRLAVPYRYCGDEFVDYEPTCLRYDAGADEYETLTSVVDTYWNYYLANNFMRQRVGFDPGAVAGTVYSRYFAKLEDANLYYTLYRGMLRSYGADDEFFMREDGFLGYTLGIGAAYGLLTRVLATPEPGCHAQSTLDGQPFLTPSDDYGCGDDPRDITIDSFEGRELRTGYSLGPDSSFWFLTRAGYFQDKVLALQVLTDPGARVLGQDTNADIRQFQVSFYTTFTDPIQEILRGVISREWEPFAPRFTAAEGIVFPSPDDQVSGAVDGTLVDPNLSFALELYSMVFGMAYLPRTFDYRFIDSARLFVRGAAESVDLQLPDGVEVLEFLDDASGLVYMAPSYPDATGRETGISASVLLYAQQLKAEGRTSTLAAYMANINVLRRLTYVMGFGGDDSLYL